MQPPVPPPIVVAQGPIGYVGPARETTGHECEHVELLPGIARTRGLALTDPWLILKGYQLDFGFGTRPAIPPPRSDLTRFDDAEDRRVLREIYGHRFPMPAYPK